MGGPVVIEGTWEEVALHAAELAGRRVRLTVLDPATVNYCTAAADSYEPNAIIETGETATPFDLFRPDAGIPIAARPGGVRLPDPLPDDSRGS